MMLSKMNTGAMGAAGSGVPDKVAQDAWFETTKEQAVGASQWFVRREGDTVSAGIVREVPPRLPGNTNAPLYRLRLVCNASAGSGEMHLTWSPQPQTNRSVTVSADGGLTVEYRVEGMESMGNGASVKTGRASLLLTGNGDRRLPFAKKSLTVQGLFPGETIDFPFESLDKDAQLSLSKCFQ
jgi:hypothetical protein